MNVLEFPLALFAFFAFVAVVPAWIWFVNSFGEGLPTEVGFIAQMVLPATIALYLGSWVQRG